MGGTPRPCSGPAQPAEEGGCPLSSLSPGRSAPMSGHCQRTGTEVRGMRQVLFWVSATSLSGRQARGSAGRRRAGAAGPAAGCPGPVTGDPHPVCWAGLGAGGRAESPRAWGSGLEARTGWPSPRLRQGNDLSPRKSLRADGAGLRSRDRVWGLGWASQACKAELSHGAGGGCGGAPPQVLAGLTPRGRGRAGAPAYAWLGVAGPRDLELRLAALS